MKTQAYNYHENVIRWLFLTCAAVCFFYIVFYLHVGSLSPIAYTSPFLLIYTFGYFNIKRVNITVMTYGLLFTTGLQIFLAALFYLEKVISLHYLYFAYGPAIHIMLNREPFYRKMLLSILSIILILFFELRPPHEAILVFDDDMNQILKVVTLLAVGIQLIVPISLYSYQISNNEALFYQHSILDPLTGLFNRGYLPAYLLKHNNKMEDQQAKQEDEPPPKGFSLMLLDIDHFKRINDKYGHHSGDQVLIKVSALLSQTIRHCDSAFRYGGEEFLIMLPDTQIEEAALMAERIRSQLEQMETGIDGLKTSASIGIAWCQHTDDIQALIGEADLRLYKAKNKGRNRIEYEL
jgi:diguanylate cyclase (GGDEF)-like protein